LPFGLLYGGLRGADGGQWPGYQVWVIHRVVGGSLYCARSRLDQSAAVVSADDSGDLAVLIGDQAGNQG
jgi:hypothetical protein